MADRKTALTFEEKITAAFMHYVRQIDQQDIAMMYGVNMGRINEACNAIRKTLQPPGDPPSIDREETVKRFANG